MSRNTICSLTYVWIGGSGELRSKVKYLPRSDLFDEEQHEGYPSLNRVPEWTFDGSSTGQAATGNSDVFIKPVRLYYDPFSNGSEHSPCRDFLVLCATYDQNGNVHPTNHRDALCETLKAYDGDNEFRFGIEQEYVLFDRTNKPYGWLERDNPGLGPQGPYYCSTGGDRNFGRNISDKHARLCLAAGVKICGTNAEVMPAQHEYQLGVSDGLLVSDDLWISRYILHRVTEEFECWVSLDPKPLEGDWNGSGCHLNCSTKRMREPNGYRYIIEACERLALRHAEHIAVYGTGNERRLSGQHETSDIHHFSYAEAHRGTSVRIPSQVVRDRKGQLEDRRPASNMDPYLVVERIVRTLGETYS